MQTKYLGCSFSLCLFSQAFSNVSHSNHVNLPQEIPEEYSGHSVPKIRVSRTPYEASSRSQHGIPKEKMGLTVSGQMKDAKPSPATATLLVESSSEEDDDTSLSHGTPGHSSAQGPDGPLNRSFMRLWLICPKKQLLSGPPGVTQRWLGRGQSRTGISREPEWKCYHLAHGVVLFRCRGSQSRVSCHWSPSRASTYFINSPSPT